MEKDFYPECQGASEEPGVWKGEEMMHVETEEAPWGWQNLTLAK